MKRKLQVSGALAVVAISGAAVGLTAFSAGAAPQAPTSDGLAVFKAAPLSAAELAKSPFNSETNKSLSELIGTPLDPLTAHLTGTASTSPWVVQSTDGSKVCLVNQAPAGQGFGVVCDNAGGGKVGSEGLFGTSHPAPDAKDQRVLVTAIVPDGVTSVTLKGASGEKQTVAVSGNAIGAKVSFAPASADLARGSSVSSTSLGDAR